MWWPFAKKPEVKQEGPSELEQAEARVSVLRAWCDVGQEFEYLGRRMMVVKHSRLDMAPGIYFPLLRLVPELHARYADDHGQLHTLVLSESEALALAARPLQPNV